MITSAAIAAWRQRMGYTHRQAAQALDVTLATYQRWERGTDFTSGKPVTIELRTALACAALEARLEPIKSSS